MTASPLLPPGMTGPTAETEATDAELSRMTELALSRGARAIAPGDPAVPGGRTTGQRLTRIGSGNQRPIWPRACTAA